MESLNAESTPAWYKIALKELGVKEFEGPENNPRVIEYHSATSLESKSDLVPWCSSFVNWCLKQSGEHGTNSASARSFLKWGKKVDTPYKGCIVVLSRGLAWQGHVGFFVHEQNGLIGILGGNQDNRVSIDYYSKSNLLGYREPDVFKRP